jgi:hypothetical protein
MCIFLKMRCTQPVTLERQKVAQVVDALITDIPETSRIHSVLFGMHRTIGPYLAAIDRILISLI